jgi:hypothetical protein
MRRAVAALVVVLVPATLAAEDRPPLETILEHVGQYVERFEREVSGVVAEERYVQDADKSDRPFVTHRELTSDLLLVRTGGGDAASAGNYVQFRDVFEVDGEAVRDRTDRLAKLFMGRTGGDADAKRQAALIMNESARYNIGSIERNINAPLFALMLVGPSYQPRFKYSVGTEHKGTPRGLPKTDAFRLAADAWRLDYEEVGTPTVIQGDGQDARSHGRIWIDPATSRVLITELVNESKYVRATIRVSYQSAPLDDVLLPVEMRENYVLKGRFYKFDGTATYSNYRRFTVETEEKIADPDTGTK